MGLCEGVTFPCMHEVLSKINVLENWIIFFIHDQVWSKWAPPLERSRMAGIQSAGTFLGMVIAMSSCGVLAQKFGWQSVFYVFGVIGCIWYVFWLILIHESPDKDPHISLEEKRYIMASLQHTQSSIKSKDVPWKSIFTSSAVWAIAASHFAENWGVYTMLTQLPLFLKRKSKKCETWIELIETVLDNLNFDLANSGFIASVPYLTLGILLFFVGYLADWLRIKGYLTTTQVRRYFNCSAFVSQTVFMMLAGKFVD